MSNLVGLLPGASASAAAQAISTTAQQAQQKQSKLVDAAHQFEGMLLEQLLKPLQKSQDGGFSQDADDDDRDGSLDAMTSYGTEALSNAISKQGGLGIAKQIIRQVSHQAEKQSTSQ